MSSNTTTINNETPPTTKDESAESTQSAAPLALPWTSTSTEHDTQADVTTLQTVKLDQLGPMVVNSDGTLSRISNWADMDETERARTLRILGKRNMLRKEKLDTEADDGKEQLVDHAA